MTCTLPLRATRRTTTAAATTAFLLAAIMTVAATTAARAQTPTPPPQPPVPAPGPVVPAPAPPVPQIVAYRAPVLALVQPPPGALTVPQDRPVVVFRFAQGEADDPVDAATFRVAVDGRDRTAQFQVAAGEAWGPLGDAAAPVAAGAHPVSARVCSSRGACGTADATVTAMPVAVTQSPSATSKTGRRARVIGFVLDATKRLLAP